MPSWFVKTLCVTCKWARSPTKRPCWVPKRLAWPCWPPPCLSLRYFYPSVSWKASLASSSMSLASPLWRPFSSRCSSALRSTPCCRVCGTTPAFTHRATRQRTPNHQPICTTGPLAASRIGSTNRPSAWQKNIKPCWLGRLITKNQHCHWP